MDNALKALRRTDDELRVGNYIVLFGGRDMEGVFSDRVNADGSTGEYFAPDTELESSYTKGGMLYVDWEHGLDDAPGAPKAGDLLGVVDWSTAKRDDTGVWVERALNRRSRYVQALEALIDAGLVGNSSEADPDGVQKADDGKILRWPLRRDTLTVTPMEPRMLTENVVSALKALNIELPAIKPEPEAEPEASQDAATAAKATTDKQPESTEQQEDEMSEEQKIETPAVDLEAIVAKAVADGIAGYKAELAKEPPIDEGGLVVIEDEADKAIKARPYKGLGEFLMDVKNATLGHVDQRLLPLRSREAVDEGGFSLNGALGDKFVGGLTKSAFTKQTGLNEGVGAAGGFLVGTDDGGSILDRVYQVGELLRRVDMVGVSPGSNGMTFNAVNETSRADGSRRGGIRAYWTAEAGTKVASQPEFRELELRLHKCVGLVYATDELLQDANALESWIMRNLPEELRFVVEDSIIRGTGVGMPQGILLSGALVTVAAEAGQAADTLVVQNIVNMYSRMYAPSRRNAVWLINQDVEPQLYQLSLGVGTGGQPVYLPPGGLSGAPYATLMGKPVIASEYADTVGDVGDIMFVDLSEYQMIEKGGMQSASSIHVNFTTDETVFRFVYRVDGISKWNATLTPFQSALTQSPFVALAAR